MHITDVVTVITWNDLDDVILAGHSYAGSVITGVADRVPKRIAQLVYVDSAPFAGGMVSVDLDPPAALTAPQQTVDETGDGWRIPFPGFAALAEETSLAGLGERERGLIAAKAVPQPWGTYTQPLRPRQTGEPPYRRVLIACDEMQELVAAGMPQIAPLAAPPWHSLELDTGHWPMFSAPEELARCWMGWADKRRPPGARRTVFTGERHSGPGAARCRMRRRA